MSAIGHATGCFVRVVGCQPFIVNAIAFGASGKLAGSVALAKYTTTRSRVFLYDTTCRMQKPLEKINATEPWVKAGGLTASMRFFR